MPLPMKTMEEMNMSKLSKEQTMKRAWELAEDISVKNLIKMRELDLMGTIKTEMEYSSTEHTFLQMLYENKELKFICRTVNGELVGNTIIDTEAVLATFFGEDEEKPDDVIVVGVVLVDGTDFVIRFSYMQR